MAQLYGDDGPWADPRAARSRPRRARRPRLRRRLPQGAAPAGQRPRRHPPRGPRADAAGARRAGARSRSASSRRACRSSSGSATASRRASSSTSAPTARVRELAGARPSPTSSPTPAPSAWRRRSGARGHGHVDASRGARTGARTWRTPPGRPRDHTFVADDAFALARARRPQGQRFDLVVLDPPSYRAPSALASWPTATTADLAASALAILSPGGRVPPPPTTAASRRRVPSHPLRCGARGRPRGGANQGPAGGPGLPRPTRGRAQHEERARLRDVRFGEGCPPPSVLGGSAACARPAPPKSAPLRVAQGGAERALRVRVGRAPRERLAAATRLRPVSAGSSELALGAKPPPAPRESRGKPLRHVLPGAISGAGRLRPQYEACRRVCLTRGRCRRVLAHSSPAPPSAPLVPSLPLPEGA